MRTILLLLSLATVAGCASTPMEHRHRHGNDFDRLERECRDRGGMLVPIPGATSTEDSANYACEFRGQSPKR
jgi:hypothetical protein